MSSLHCEPAHWLLHDGLRLASPTTTPRVCKGFLQSYFYVFFGYVRDFDNCVSMCFFGYVRDFDNCVFMCFFGYVKDFDNCQFLTKDET